MKCHSAFANGHKKPYNFKFEWPEFSQAMSTVLNEPWLEEPLRNFRSTPAVNVSETDEAYFLEMAAPGYEKEDFKIDVDGHSLKISSKKAQENDTNDSKRYTKREFKYSHFERSFKLPKEAHKEHITAKYHNGILTLHIPKQDIRNNTTSQTIHVE
ncbi:MAG: Hsp20/alpha crystallin family protein [Cytophagales bacterium]|nr:MAG: Hsp20/alpha crystallin family protein [Cytophagales bacterium]TAF59658.1 MAG: Hsp20/alpha crystallin family protein [Cytophagales bacterium]